MISSVSAHTRPAESPLGATSFDPGKGVPGKREPACIKEMTVHVLAEPERINDQTRGPPWVCPVACAPAPAASTRPHNQVRSVSATSPGGSTEECACGVVVRRIPAALLADLGAIVLP